MFIAGAPIELTILAWSVVLLLLQVVLQAASATADLGLPYNLSPRDARLAPKGRVAGRLQRALANLLETYPAFVALALALVVAGKTGGTGTTGAWLWLGARVAYVVVYALGIPGIRTLVWAVSIVGLVMMLTRLFA
jgi:uncharacterized MAPEG superfamily protein